MFNINCYFSGNEQTSEVQELLVMRNKLTDQNDGIEHEIMVGYIISLATLFIIYVSPPICRLYPFKIHLIDFISLCCI